MYALYVVAAEPRLVPIPARNRYAGRDSWACTAGRLLGCSATVVDTQVGEWINEHGLCATFPAVRPHHSVVWCVTFTVLAMSITTACGVIAGGPKYECCAKLWVQLWLTRVTA